jgi:hypothetical protein
VTCCDLLWLDGRLAFALRQDECLKLALQCEEEQGKAEGAVQGLQASRMRNEEDAHGARVEKAELAKQV